MSAAFPTASPPPSPGVPLRSGGAAAGLVIAGLLAYLPAVRGPFLLDDEKAIVSNATIRHLWPIGGMLSPPPNIGVGGRPLLNASFALNYAWGGAGVVGYHLVNVIIHCLAALTLFGLVRRTLLQPSLAARFGGRATGLAGAIACLWMLHPLQTEAVAYISERAESLMGLCYLVTLYAFVRAATGPVAAGWAAAAVIACAAGLLVKETMVTAPVMVLLYDRTFLAGSFAGALRQRGRWYAGLAASWLILPIQLAGLGRRSAGFGLGVSPWTYALTESRAVLHYLRLSLWPSPLVFDYGHVFAHHLSEVTVPATALVVLLGLTGWALVRAPAWGFLGAWFFIILAPSSSFVPVALQPVAEHRVYLSLAAVVAAVVVGGYARWGRSALAVAAVAIAAAALLTVRRNRDYGSELALWSETVRLAPANSRAHNDLGVALGHLARWPEAIAAYQRAQELDPTDAEVESNWGTALLHLGHPLEAIPHFRRSLALLPHFAAVESNLGYALLAAGRPAEALPEFERAIARRPELAEPHAGLSRVFQELGRGPEAIAEAQAAVARRPEWDEPHLTLATALAAAGRSAEAMAEFRAALRANPTLPGAHSELGRLLLEAGRPAEAIEEWRAALAGAESAELHFNLGLALGAAHRWTEAAAEHRAALRLRSAFPEADNGLGVALAQIGKMTDAQAAFRAALRLQPDYQPARDNLAQLQRLPGAASP